MSITRDWPCRATPLTDEDIRAIRAAFTAGEWVSRLARRYQLSRQATYNILNRRSYAHVQEVGA